MIENDIILNIIILCQIILGLFFILLDVNIFAIESIVNWTLIWGIANAGISFAEEDNRPTKGFNRKKMKSLFFK